jgi:hypothetical protein
MVAEDVMSVMKSIFVRFKTLIGARKDKPDRHDARSRGVRLQEVHLTGVNITVRTTLVYL